MRWYIERRSEGSAKRRAAKLGANQTSILANLKDVEGLSGRFFAAALPRLKKLFIIGTASEARGRPIFDCGSFLSISTCTLSKDSCLPALFQKFVRPTMRALFS
jgi:hypothetical protein